METQKCLLVVSNRSEEIAKWLGANSALSEYLVQIPVLTLGSSQLPVTPALRNMVHSSKNLCVDAHM